MHHLDGLGCGCPITQSTVRPYRLVFPPPAIEGLFDNAHGTVTLTAVSVCVKANPAPRRIPIKTWRNHWGQVMAEAHEKRSVRIDFSNDNSLHSALGDKSPQEYEWPYPEENLRKAV